MFRREFTKLGLGALLLPGFDFGKSNTDNYFVSYFASPVDDLTHAVPFDLVLPVPKGQPVIDSLKAQLAEKHGPNARVTLINYRKEGE